MIIETHDPEETFEVGRKIGMNAKPGQIYTLTGDLGVGKTVFTQGVAAGLGITEPVNSPHLPLSRNMRTGVCHFIILMYIVSEIWKKWRRSDTMIIFSDRESASSNGQNSLRRSSRKKGLKLPLRKTLRRVLSTERSPLRREGKRQNESFGTGQFRDRGIGSRCGG